MKRYLLLRIDDPDNFMNRLWIDEYGHYRSEINEGELPPRFPTFTYEKE